jgi:hypothetical protein
MVYASLALSLTRCKHILFHYEFMTWRFDVARTACHPVALGKPKIMVANRCIST